VESILDGMDGVSTVHGRFYLLHSEMHFLLHDTANYYRSALKFMGCTDIHTLSHEEQRIHAHKLAVAALVSDGIYNFGELVRRFILQVAFLVASSENFNADTFGF